MPISQTVSGIILFDPLNSTSTGWSKHQIGWGGASGTLTLYPTYFMDFQDSTPGSSGFDLTGWFSKTLNVGIGPGRRIRISQRINYVDIGAVGCPSASWFTAEAVVLGALVVGSTSLSTNNYYSAAPLFDWRQWLGSMPTAFADNQTIIINKVEVANPGSASGPFEEGACNSFVRNLLIYTSDMVTVAGLATGQKVELYRASDNHLIGSGTVSGGASSVGIDTSLEAILPELLYVKIYGIDGSTLLETSSGYQMCGGDTWTWTPAGTFVPTVDNYVIYRQAALASPKIATITSTLLDSNAQPYPNATVYFYTSRGTLSATSAVTDVNGQVTVQLTSDTYGLVVVAAQFPGDANVAPNSGAVSLHVFYDAEVADPSQDFQFYCEGVQYIFTSGTYSLISDNVVGQFQIGLSAWDDGIATLGLVSIYRQGVKEFSGVMAIPERTISGASPDSIWARCILVAKHPTN